MRENVYMDTGELLKKMMGDFIAHFVSDAECLYLRDSVKGVLSSNENKLKVLGFDISQESNLPDIVLYGKAQDRLYLVDSIASGRVIDEARFEELSTQIKREEKVKVLVTAFPNFQSFKNNVEKLAWDTVAWIAEVPGHLIYLEKEGTLEPIQNEKEYQH